MKNILQPQLVSKKTISVEEFLNNITVKKYQECRTSDGYAYSADIYYKNIFLCFINDDGNGGELRVQTYSKVSKGEYTYDNTIYAIFETIDKKDLHRVTDIKNADGSYFEYTQDLETLLSRACDNHLEEKENKKIFNKGIIYETEKGTFKKEGAYRCISWGKKSIRVLSKLDYMKPKIQETIDKLLRENKFIINEDYLKTLGFIL